MSIEYVVNAIEELNIILDDGDSEKIALAAIAAMRKPTKEMIAAAWRVLNPCGEKCLEKFGTGPGIKEAWQAMIDEMLK